MKKKTRLWPVASRAPGPAHLTLAFRRGYPTYLTLQELFLDLSEPEAYTRIGIYSYWLAHWNKRKLMNITEKKERAGGACASV